MTAQNSLHLLLWHASTLRTPGYLLKQAEQAENPAYAAHIYALLNDEPRAIAALELAYNKREPGILFIRTAPELDSICSSPRFHELVRRIGFPSSAREKN